MNRKLAILVILFSFLLVASGAYAANWKVPGDFATIQEAIYSPEVRAGDTILVGPGEFSGALVDKSVKIKGTRGAVINDGPPHPHPNIKNQGFRLLNGSEGTTISRLIFSTTDLSIMNSEAVNDVTITQCTFINSIQAISNWSGSGWKITRNEIVDLRTICGGGIGIFVGDWTGGIVKNNVVSRNKISGTLHVSENDCGGYEGSGIVLYADFRWGRAGAAKLTKNRIRENEISLISDNPELVNVRGIELTDTRTDPPSVVIFGNRVTDNDIEDVSGEGIYVEGAPGNLFKENEIEDSGGFDAFDDTTGDDTAGTGNKWDDNDCDKSSPGSLCGEGDDDDDDDDDD